MANNRISSGPIIATIVIVVFVIVMIVMHAGIREGRGFFDDDQGIGTMALTIGSFALASTSAIFLWGTLQASRQTNQVALNVGKAQVRSYLSVTNVTLACLKDVNGGKAKATITVRNSGQSPAISPALTINIRHAFKGTSFNYEKGHGRLTADLSAQSEITESVEVAVAAAEEFLINWQRTEVTVTCAAHDVFGERIGTLAIFRQDNGTERHFDGEFTLRRVLDPLIPINLRMPDDH